MDLQKLYDRYLVSQKSEDVTIPIALGSGERYSMKQHRYKRQKESVALEYDAHNSTMKTE